jgi:hypothetical protein
MSSKLDMLSVRYLQGILVEVVNRQDTGENYIEPQDTDLSNSTQIQ